ncbi:MAG: polyprenyl synthetase family protein [bacterium]
MNSNTSFDLQEYLGRRKALIDQHLVSFVPKCEGPASTLFEAMRYTLEAGGKRIRPIFLIAGADFVVGLEPQDIMRGDWAGSRNPEWADGLLRAACAVEMIHTYSLIHDDLPCMDDDDLRRGAPTCHKVYGEAIALLAGDALLTHAFSVIGKIGPPLKERAIDAAGELADGCGAEGMVAGQAVDLISERTGGDESHLEYIHRRKTAALFRSSLAVGGILAGANDHDLAVLRSVGEVVGLIFQVVDDILDVEGTTEELGKSTGRDAELGKLTYPGLLGLEEAHHRVSGLLSEAGQLLKTCGPRAKPISILTSQIAQRRN